jgi:hypothetical protein
VVIIGGGMTGLYAAYRLMNTTNYKIGLFEKESIFGGKMITEKFDDFVIEYGPRKLETGIQTRVMKLIYDLNIEIDKKSESHILKKSSLDINNLNDKEVEIYNNFYKMKTNIPLYVIFLKYGLSFILGDQWDFNSSVEQTRDREIRKENLRKFGKFKGKMLFCYGILDLLKDILSVECLQYILSEGELHYMLDKNPNASEIICILLDIIESYKWDYIYIKGGGITLINKLHHKIQDKVDIKLDHLLNSVSSYSKSVICANFTNLINSKTIYCKYIIFALPPSAIYKIDGFPKDTLKIMRSSFIKVDLVKIFVIINNPPWEVNEEQNNIDLIKVISCKQVEYFWNPKKKTIGILWYYDKESQMYLLENIQNDIINKLDTLLYEKYPDKSGWDIRIYGIEDWTTLCNNSELFLWKPGVNTDQVMSKLSSFSFHTYNKAYRPNMHICCEAVSNFQCFIEGSLASVESIEEKMVVRKDGSYKFSLETHK